jgi:hypothetical protein
MIITWSGTAADKNILEVDIIRPHSPRVFPLNDTKKIITPPKKKEPPVQIHHNTTNDHPLSYRTISVKPVLSSESKNQIAISTSAKRFKFREKFGLSEIDYSGSMFDVEVYGNFKIGKNWRFSASTMAVRDYADLKVRSTITGSTFSLTKPSISTADSHIFNLKSESGLSSPTFQFAYKEEFDSKDKGVFSSLFGSMSVGVGYKPPIGKIDNGSSDWSIFYDSESSVVEGKLMLKVFGAFNMVGDLNEITNRGLDIELKNSFLFTTSLIYYINDKHAMSSDFGYRQNPFRTLSSTSDVFGAPTYSWNLTWYQKIESENSFSFGLGFAKTGSSESLSLRLSYFLP